MDENKYNFPAMSRTNSKVTQGAAAPGIVDEVKKDPDSNYFKSYGRLTIHRTMLRDRSRVKAYANAIAGTDMRGKVKCVVQLS